MKIVIFIIRLFYKPNDIIALLSLNKEFPEINYPRGRAIEVFRSFHFDLKAQKSKFIYYSSPKTFVKSFDLSSRRGISGTPR